MTDGRSPAPPEPSRNQGWLTGVIHLPALPGSPRSELGMRAIVERTVSDAQALKAAGFDQVMIENFGDVPFYRGKVPPVTVSAMTACAEAVRAAFPEWPLGINVLRNDAEAALAIAAVTSAACIRINVHTGARVTDQGVVEGEAAHTLRARRALGAGAVAIWADVDVKHSAALAERPIVDEAKDLTIRGLADAVLVTGEGTGCAADPQVLGAVRGAIGQTPLYVASGASIGELASLASLSDGVIVGSALRADGRAGGPIDPSAAARFADAFRKAFRR
jgi:membrane complex biogenesis BtpA family protein